MFKSIFTDELGMDLEQALPILKSWGLNKNAMLKQTS